MIAGMAIPIPGGRRGRGYNPGEQENDSTLNLCTYSAESLHQKLRSNDESFCDLQVWLHGSCPVRELTDAIRMNRSVQEVSCLIHYSFGDKTTGEIVQLFDAIGRLPQLRRWLFNPYRVFLSSSPLPRLPIQAMTMAFLNAHSLVELTLWRCLLVGSQVDFDSWATSLQQLRSLKKFQIIRCQLPTVESYRRRRSRRRVYLDEDGSETTESITTTISRPPHCTGNADSFPLDPLIQMSCFLPHLQEIQLSASSLSALGNLHGSSLHQLLSLSTTLTELSLWNFDLSDDALVAVANAMLTSNNTLRRLRVAGPPKALEKQSRQAFSQVLKDNFNLQLLFLWDERNLQDEIRLYLKLNRYGRKTLLQNDNKTITTTHTALRDQWFNTLLHLRDDLDCIFYLLTHNPLLLNFCHPQDTPTTEEFPCNNVNDASIPEQDTMTTQTTEELPRNNPNDASIPEQDTRTTTEEFPCSNSISIPEQDKMTITEEPPCNNGNDASIPEQDTVTTTEEFPCYNSISMPEQDKMSATEELSCNNSNDASIPEQDKMTFTEELPCNKANDASIPEQDKMTTTEELPCNNSNDASISEQDKMSAPEEFPCNNANDASIPEKDKMTTK